MRQVGMDLVCRGPSRSGLLIVGHQSAEAGEIPAGQVRVLEEPGVEYSGPNTPLRIPPLGKGVALGEPGSALALPVYPPGIGTGHARPPTGVRGAGDRPDDPVLSDDQFVTVPGL